MKVSYKILKKYLPYIESAESVSKDLIMHTAEVEEILSEKKSFENIVIGIIKEISKHPDADNLSVCQVDIGESELSQIVCGGDNLAIGQKVVVAKPGSKVLWHGEGELIELKKTSLRGVESNGMICASEEIGLKEQFPQKGPKNILDLSFLNDDAGTLLSKALNKDDEVLVIDNKAINHRPDMFSYMGVLREISTINKKNIDLNYENIDFSNLKTLDVENKIPSKVKRYSLLSVSNVENITSNQDIKTIIESAGHSVKGLLIDLSNYSLYFYGQPAHIFDRDKINGKIEVRFAKTGEILEALDDKTYNLTSNDIVIADQEKILALGGIIGGKSSAVSKDTKNILIETAHFDQAILRITGKNLGLRTDALNVFEKDIMPETCHYATSLILKELQNNFKNLTLDGYFDSYPIKQKKVTQKLDIDFYNDLLGTSYKKEEITDILKNLGINIVGDTLEIPFWRKELTTKADIAEEIARITGYDKIIQTIPRINLGAIIQNPIYNLKNDSKTFFSHKGFFDVFNYSFVNNDLMQKLNQDTSNLVDLKNSLSLDATHLRGSLIPNLMKGLQDNIKNLSSIKLFEIEKVFYKKENNIVEKYMLSGVMVAKKDIVYYDLQNILSDFFKTIFVDNFYFEKCDKNIEFAHNGRVAKIILRGKEIGIIGEIHPSVAKRFDIEDRVGFFEIDAEKLLSGAYNKTKAKDLSIYQENNFDLSIVVDKSVNGRDIYQTILQTDKKLIQDIELFDIYENNEKLPGKRSLSFKIFIQSTESTIKDDVKTNLIQEIIKRVEKKGGSLR
ncbi:phenylalanine--tRNA ligase subunit beta [Candidatus Gracilibacteria bacterium]|nr:phenylalanine--tRNA ligase subunit beta [Candidatus Gracilibacteria bacterium]